MATQYKDTSDTSVPGGAIKPVLLVSTVQNGSRGGLYRSLDGGDIWTRISGLGLSSLPDGSITDLEVVPDPNSAGNSLLFAAHAGAQDTYADAGIYESPDGGATWTDVTSQRQVFAGDGNQRTFNYIFTYNVTNAAYLSVYVNGTKSNPGAYNVSGAGNPNGTVTFTTAPADKALVVIQLNQVPDIDPAQRYGFVAAKPNRITLAVSAGAAGQGTVIYASVLTTKSLVRVFKTGDLGATWSFVVDTPGSRDIVNGTEQFVGINPGGQGDLHFSMTVDPNNANQVYLGGDTQKSLGANSPVHNQLYTGRLFIVNASSAASKADIDAGKARGSQLTADGALLGDVPDVSGTTGADNSTATADNNGGNRQLSQGNYYYLFTFVDPTGVESNPSDEIGPVAVQTGHGVELVSLPQRPTGRTRLNIYRTKANGSTFYLVGNVPGTQNTNDPYVDGLGDAALTVQRDGRAAPDVKAFGTKRGTKSGGDGQDVGGSMVPGTYQYKIAFFSSSGMSFVSDPVSATLDNGKSQLTLTNIPVGPVGTTFRQIFRKVGAAGPSKL